MEIVPQLNINRHPRDCKNYSLVNAKNVVYSEDDSCFQNEESIDYLYSVKSVLDNSNFEIITCIPCNNELVIFVKDRTSNIGKIYRYNEKDDTILPVINNFDYHGGKIKGTYTTNVNNELIIAFAEQTDGVPVKTINLDRSDTDYRTFPLVPEVNLPIIKDFNYITEKAYKGIYYTFIRYKINDYDYTQWYPIGFPIINDEYNENIIFKQYFNIFNFVGGIFEDGKRYIGSVSFNDLHSNELNICNTSFKLFLDNIDTKFKELQLGFVIQRQDSTKLFNSIDIRINKTIEFVVNNRTIKEYESQDLIYAYYNYYNVGNIINFKNKLYISNYNETNLNNESLVDNVEDITLKYNLTTKNVHTVEAPTEIKRVVKFVYQLNRNGLVNNYTKEITITDNDDEYVELSLYELFNIVGYIAKVSLFKWNVNKGDANNYGMHPYPNYFCSVGIITANTKIKIPIKEGPYGSPYEIINMGTPTGSVDYPFPTNTAVTIVNDGVNLSSVTEDSNVFHKIVFYYEDPQMSSTITESTKYVILNSFVSTVETVDISKRETSELTKITNEKNYNDTLLPNEIYNFYIHFVDKYGVATNGYKINPEASVPIIQGADNSFISNICLKYNNIYYTAVFRNNDLIRVYDEDTETYSLDISNVKYIQTNDGPFELTNFNSLISPTYLADTQTRNVLNTNLLNILATFNNPKYNNYKWIDVLRNITPCVVENSIGQKFFKTPSFNIKDNRLLLDLGITEIPEEYVGYFISYEKFETNNKYGFVNSKKEFYSDELDILDNIEIDYDYLYKDITYSSNTAKLVKKYINLTTTKNDENQNADIDILPINLLGEIASDTSIDKAQYLNISNIKLRAANNILQDNYGRSSNLLLTLDENINFEDVPNPYIEYFDNIVLSKLSKDYYLALNKTLIRLGNIYYGVPNGSITIDHGYNGYFTSDNSIWFNNAVFDSAIVRFNSTIGTYTITGTDTKTGYGISYPYTPANYLGNADNFSIQDYENNTGYTYVRMVKTSYIDTYIHETKSFKDKPKKLATVVTSNNDNTKGEKSIQNLISTIITPDDTINLYENKSCTKNIVELITYQNYNNLYNIDNNRFDKTIRRSYIIADESRENNWRKFDTNAYKYITENKGKITNLVGIGEIFLIHTEHSLFKLDSNNYLLNGDTAVKTEDKDIFDIQYKEIFSSLQGFGGLQDDEAWIVGKFGYIWFDNDAQRFCSFDANRFDFIDDDIFTYFKDDRTRTIISPPAIRTRIIKKIQSARFVEDKNYNRILISIAYRRHTAGALFINNYITLSYNYDTKTFISLHTYYFDKGFNTKDNCYLKDKYSAYLHKFTERFIDPVTRNEIIARNRYDNYITIVDDYFDMSSKLSIIINPQYNDIKYLEYIKYVLHCCEYVENDLLDINIKRLLGDKIYSGNLLKIYNDIIDTGELNINVGDATSLADYRFNETTQTLPGLNNDTNNLLNYTKPHFDLGNWNMNLLRDNSFTDANTKMKFGDINSRLFGNYFVIEFTMTTSDKWEFEGIETNLTLNRL